MIYFKVKKLKDSWLEFMFDLDSVWPQLKIRLKDLLQRCKWKTKFLAKSLERLFWSPSVRISHPIHIVWTFCSPLAVRSRIFCLLGEVVYRPCGYKFVYPMMNFTFLGITVNVKLPVKFCLHSFEWFCLQISSDAKYVSLLSMVLWLRIASW